MRQYAQEDHSKKREGCTKTVSGCQRGVSSPSETKGIGGTQLNPRPVENAALDLPKATNLVITCALSGPVRSESCKQSTPKQNITSKAYSSIQSPRKSISPSPSPSPSRSLLPHLLPSTFHPPLSALSNQKAQRINKTTAQVNSLYIHL
jgi:hypothetical protein